MAVVGVVGGEVFGAAAHDAIATADVLVGSPRHLERFRTGDTAVERVDLVGTLAPLVELIAARRAAGRRVCVLSSGDPGFFGIARTLRPRFVGDELRVHPAPSSVSLAWAAIGLSWDDADVVSAHGRPLRDAIEHTMRSAKVAVLTSPTNPPEVLGKELLASGCGPRRAVVVSRIGEADERIVDTDLHGLAAGQHDGLSVLLLIAPGRADADAPPLSWGRDEDEFAHRRGMITKAEVRSIVLGQLMLPRAGVLWDVAAGSGSIGVEAATVAPGLHVCAVEQVAADAVNITINARRAGVVDQVDVVVARAPDALDGLPDPDRVFVGGGGLDVVRTCWERLRPGGVLVATFVLIDRAVAALDLLGEMIQVHVDRSVPLAGVGMRLEPTNPVFVCRGRR
ncbi:MAG: cbiE [Ilumatobacteraceae bacterium]|nr:cbiE [Ilumatobacteraceae bacterium]